MEEIEGDKTTSQSKKNFPNYDPSEVKYIWAPHYPLKAALEAQQEAALGQFVPVMTNETNA